MECPNCGHDNRPGSRFCAECGTKLELVCPVCSETSPPEARFCWNCGSALGRAAPVTPVASDATRYVPPEMLAKIDAARATNTMRGERRTVTMLFADIQGSTAAAEGLDPEEWSEIINGAFEHLIAPVYRYEGTLARLLGDAVLAFFGAPIAHEDDPVRAVRAGLEILEAMEPYQEEIAARWGIPIGVRVGISTGLVVVGEVGSDLRVDYTALGDAVNVAARMEQTAEPGTVRLTERTWNLVDEYFEAERIGPVDVKGKSEPVIAYRATAYHPRPQASRTRPLIGRADQLERLVALCDELRHGSGWVASIIGEAGVGKSRLLEEIRFRAAETASAASFFDGAGDVGWMAAFVESYDSSVPYSVVRDLLRRWWGLDDIDEPFERIQRATSALRDPDSAAYLGYVAGVRLGDREAAFVENLEPPVLHSRVRDAFIRYLEAEAGRRPLVLAVEDVHWADPMSLALVEGMMDASERVPVGLLFSMRPQREEPAWALHEAAERDHPHRYHPFSLGSLDDPAAEAMLDVCLADIDAPPALKRRILERADGNPLFIEQMSATLRDTDVDLTSIPVPTGLSSLLTARLDQLDVETRTVAQVAAVVGAEFDRGTLAALLPDGFPLDRHLTELLRRSVAVERRGSPGMLAFHHALMREAAYSTMLLRTRRQLHARLAEYLTDSAPDAVQDIAMHLLEAGEAARAFPYLIAAGAEASRAMALSDAIRLFSTALDHVPAEADTELVVKAHDGLGFAYSLVPDLTQSQAAYQRLVDYADQSGRPFAKVTALNRLAVATAILSGDIQEATRYLEDAHDLAMEVGDEFGLAEYHMNACMISGLSGDTMAALAHDEETARWGERLGAEGIRIEGLSRLAVNAAWLMNWDQAEQAIRDAEEGARQSEDELTLAILDGMGRSRLRLREGDLAAAVRILRDSGDTIAKYGSIYSPFVQALSASLLYEQGHIEEGLRHLHESRKVLIESSMPFFDSLTSAVLSRIYGMLGMADESLDLRSVAVAALELPFGGFLASTVWVELGLAGLALGRLDEAAADFERGLGVSAASQYWEKPRLLIGRALTLAAAEDHPAAAARLTEAEAFVEAKGLRTYDVHLSRTRGQLLVARGRLAEGAASLAETVGAAREKGWRMEALQAAHAAAVAGEADDVAAATHGEILASLLEGVRDPLIRQALQSRWSLPSEPAIPA